MKLWLKISLIAIIMVTLATSVCSLIMLLRSGQSQLELAVQSVLTDQQVRAGSWSAAMENAVDPEDSAAAHRSLARYLITKFADRNTILLSNDDIIYNATDIDPKKVLPVKGDAQQYIIQDRNGKYSLGMRQRLGIAQAIMENPSILILDEPFNGLEKNGAAQMRELIRGLREQGKTILLASHNQTDIDELCDTVCEMDAGILTVVRT